MATPVTTPPASTVAIAVLLLVHVPPVVVLASEVVVPTQPVADPVIAAGSAFTVTSVITVQPVVVVYVIADVPAATPVTIPVEVVIVALAVLPELHVPPEGVLESVVAAPTHTVAVPAIAVGSAFTVTMRVSTHPVPVVYVIVAVPALMPATAPSVAPTVAVVASLLLHVPPVVVLLKVVTEPSQTLAVPVMPAGIAITVTVAVVLQPVASM